MSDTSLLRQIPQVDRVLREAASAVESLGQVVATRLVHEEIDTARAAAEKGEPPPDAAGMARAVVARAEAALKTRLSRVINATGVIVHTNLGRAPLSDDAVAAAAGAAGATALEIDLGSGKRGVRAPFASFLAAALTGAEAAHVVNNNAAALVLALAALARGREVIVSRGEMIEIGGEFRLPELMEASGAVLKEVGTTNRTHAKDYRRAINDRTALILKVHPSNYTVVGFTATPETGDLIAIAREAGVPVLYDVGSGLLEPDERLPGEPDAKSELAAGVDVVCFSADKLLGGPQAGIIVGEKRLIDRIRKDPLARAMRADKLTLAALEATLLAHARGDDPPVRRMLVAPLEEIRARAEALAKRIAGATVRDGESVAGGGAVPGTTIPTAVVAIAHAEPETLRALLAKNAPPVIATVKDGRLVLDLRTVRPDDDEAIATALGNIRANAEN